MTRRRLRIFLLIFYLVLIFFVSSRPDLQTPGSGFKFMDKVAHVVEYGILGVLLFEGIGRSLTRLRIGTILFLCSVGSSIGALDEIFQSYIPGRQMSVFDWIADSVGMCAGVGIAVYLWRGKRSVSKSPFHSSKKGDTAG